MSTELDLTRIVRSWLEHGATALPDHVRTNVLDLLPATPQRRPNWLARRFRTMNTMLRVAVVAALLLAAAMPLGLLPGITSQSPGSQASPSPSPSPSPIAMPDGEFEAGTSYFQDLTWFAGSPRLIFTAPAVGWEGGASFIGKGAITDTVNSVRVAMTTWDVANLNADACHWNTQGVLDPPLGPTVDDLATALVRQAGVTPSTVSDVTVGGYPGKKVELSLPAGLDVATCDLFGDGADARIGIYARWRDNGFPGGHNFGNGQQNVVYVLDLGGHRLVIDTLSMPIASQADLAELEQLVASIRFVPRASPSTSPLASQ